jgi:hypothetical protein
MRRTILVAALAVLLTPAAVSAQSPQSEADVRAAVETITPRDYYDRVSVIAHDSMRGRDTPSPGLDMTADWIASEFTRFGLQPAGDDGTFIQRYSLNMVRPNFVASSATVTGGPDLEFGRDIGFPFGAVNPTEISGGVVALGGLGNWDRVLARADLAGKHVVWVLPEGVDNLRSNRTVWQVRRAITERSPASILIVVPNQPDDFFRRAVEGQAEQVTMNIPWQERERVPMFDLRSGAAGELLFAGDVDMGQLAALGERGMRVREVDGVGLTLSPALEVVEEQSAPNVVGILEGSDPELKNEYVVFSAHMDHVGVGRPDETGDSIYNGADDDGSGTIAVVEVAEAMAGLEVAPRRSMLFLIVSGEEKGLWGSEYFANNPTVPVSEMVANLNMDMVGRNWPDTIVAIGKEHSDLGETLNRVNERHPELNMTAIDDRWPEERFYFRSDHFNFARKGVPILFFFNGTHEDYHRPSDEVDSLDTEKASRIAKLLFYLSLEVANADERPQWNPASYRQIVSDN